MVLHGILSLEGLKWVRKFKTLPEAGPINRNFAGGIFGVSSIERHAYLVTVDIGNHVFHAVGNTVTGQESYVARDVPNSHLWRFAHICLPLHFFWRCFVMRSAERR